MRSAEISRKTNETDIKLTLRLLSSDASQISTGCGFLDHMLTLFAKHGKMSLDVNCIGDINVDFHHTAEDVGIVLGQAFNLALGDKRGIARYGSIILPMDEALILSAVDISGRAHLNYDVRMPCEFVGNMSTELIEEFFISFVRSSNITLHIKMLAGKNSHHIIEGIFKAVARALSQAVSFDPSMGDEIPSTKGVI